MKKYKLSPWHDGSVKPVHVGWYQAKSGEWSLGPFLRGRLKVSKDFQAWRFWDGDKWKWCNYRNNIVEAIFEDSDKWRGILKE